MLEVDGDGLRDRPLLKRRARLTAGIRPRAALQLSEAWRGDSPLETPASPFVDARSIPRGTHSTRPELVAQIRFAEWTNDRRLRQPRLLELRDDKRPADVVRDRPR